MDTTVTINGVARTDLTVRRITQSYVAPWSCELAYVGRHDVQPVPCRINEWVHVRDVETGTLLFRGNITQISPGGVADEGIALLAQGRRFRLENEPVNINGSGAYIWNTRGYLCSHGSGEDSPGRDGGKWTVGEIIIDILEHALGLPAAGSDIPGHHSSPGCVTDPYLTADDILAYDAADWLALDSMIGEFGVDNTPVAVAISELVSMNGGFYGWFIDPYGVLRLIDLDTLPETDIEAGVLGQWQDADDTSFSLLDNRLDWSLDGVYSEVMVQGTDRTVEVKPVNLDGCANVALNGGGELELVAQPWKGWDCAYRALDQPYRPWAWKPVGFTGSCGEGEEWRDICECGIPAGSFGVYSGARIYRGTDAGAKSLCTPPLGGLNWRVNLRTGIVMFYWDVAADLNPGEKLWGWYWAKQPFTVTAGPSGNAYTCLGYERTLKIFDPGYKHTTSWPQEGLPDDETAMGILAERMLEQYKDVRIQGVIITDEVLVSLNLLRRYNVTRLEEFITEAPATSTIGEICSPDPLDWGRLGLNAVEVTWDFTQNTVEMTLANTFFMLEGYSAIKARLKLNLFVDREFVLSEDIVDCQIGASSGTPEGTTITEWPTTTTTTAEPVTTTTPGDCNECDPAIPDPLHVTLCGLLGDFAPYNGDHTLIYTTDCFWQLVIYSPFPTVAAWITLTYVGTDWIVTLNVTRGTSCRKRWTATGEGELVCAPQGVYDALDCLDDTCADNESCEDSVDATCKVTNVGETCPTTTTTTPWCDDCRVLEDRCYILTFDGECGGFDYTHFWSPVRHLVSWPAPEGWHCVWVGPPQLGMKMSICAPCPYPQLVRIYPVTLAGLRGDFAPYNGWHWAHEWVHGSCLWSVDLGDGAVVELWHGGDRWRVELRLSGSTPAATGTTTTTEGDACAIRWRHPSEDPADCPPWLDPMLPAFSYLLDGCWDDACAEGASCWRSRAATCDVSSPIVLGVALHYHPALGWIVQGGMYPMQGGMYHDVNTWLKVDDRMNACEPNGLYACADPDCEGTVVVAEVNCGPGEWPTTTTTTEAPITTTTTEAPITTTTTEAPAVCPEDCEVCDDDNTILVTVTGLLGTCGSITMGQCTAANQANQPLTRVGSTDCLWDSVIVGAIWQLYCSDGLWYFDIGPIGSPCVRFTASPLPNGCPPTAAEAWTADQGASACNVLGADVSFSWD